VAILDGVRPADPEGAHVNMFAAPEDPDGPPALDPPVTEPVTTVEDRVRRPGTARRRVVIGALVLVVLVVAGVSVALLSGGPTAGPPPVSGAAAGSAPSAGQPPQGGGQQGGAKQGGAKQGEGKQGGGQQAGGSALLIGSVVSNAGGTLVVAPDGGGPNVTVRTDTSTRMLGTGRRTPADLPPGARAVVRVSGSGSGDTARAVSVSSPQTRVTGTITALTGADLTVQQGSGLAVSVNVAAVTPAPSPPLAVGDLVAVTGTPNGTSITAGRVRVLPRAS
jgi:hypothetical protein